MTTNLVDLPTENINSNNDPIQLQTSEISNNVVIPNPSQELKIQRDADTNNLNEFVTGIQQASSTGSLELPSRDIPQDQTIITQDKNIKPNYIPETNVSNYIDASKTKEEIIRNEASREQSIINTDMLFKQYKIPIILTILYFAFQTPTINMLLNKYMPSLFLNEGNMSIMGNIVMSLLYASAYLCVENILDMLSD